MGPLGMPILGGAILPPPIISLVSTRLRNHETTDATVNDADRNPMEIADIVLHVR